MIRSVLIFALFIVLRFSAFADSPVTSTDFYKAYLDLPIIETAKQNGMINDEIAGFLLSDSNSIDKKVAVINALSWSMDGKSNAIIFTEYLGKKYNIKQDSLKVDILNADELLCLGYLIVMDNYSKPDNAIGILELARDKKPGSYTANLILALARAQKYVLNSEWCGIWAVCNNVKKDKKINTFELKPEADKIIFDYIGIYKQGCK